MIVRPPWPINVKLVLLRRCIRCSTAPCLEAALLEATETATFVVLSSLVKMNCSNQFVGRDIGCAVTDVAVPMYCQKIPGGKKP